jgi:hypothetical protein
MRRSVVGAVVVGFVAAAGGGAWAWKQAHPEPPPPPPPPQNAERTYEDISREDYARWMEELGYTEPEVKR